MSKPGQRVLAALRQMILSGELTAGERLAEIPTAERFAVRFAAKEAVLKAMGLGSGACKWREIEVARDPESQRPWIELHGAAAALAEERTRYLASRRRHDKWREVEQRGDRQAAVASERAQELELEDRSRPSSARLGDAA